jgi:hypothetical protein
MPQLDTYMYFLQVFLLLVIFIIFYILVLNNILPKISRVLKLRRKQINVDYSSIISTLLKSRVKCSDVLNYLKYFFNQKKVGEDHYMAVLNQILPPLFNRVYVSTNPICVKYIFFPLYIWYLLSHLFCWGDMLSLYVLPRLLIPVFCYLVCLELIIGYYLLPNVKLLVVRNSPANVAATIWSVGKAARGPIIAVCFACGGVVVGVNGAHEMLYPGIQTPLSKVGVIITKVTGYDPK